MSDDLPALGFAGTSGWSGTDTSRERAEEQDASGKTTKMQRSLLRFMENEAAYGATVKEIREIFGWHHGKASGMLSNLHKKGHLACLTEKREKCVVYVLPAFVEGRETRPYGGKPKAKTVDDGPCCAPAEAKYDEQALRDHWRARALRAEAVVRAAAEVSEPMAVTQTHGQLIGTYTRLRTILRGVKK